MEYYFKKQLLILSIIYFGQMLGGFSACWMTPIIPKLLDPDQTPLPDAISEVQASWVGSLIFIGAIIGPYISGYLSNIIGRKPCLFIGGLLTLVSYLILALAKDLVVIYAGRIVIGLGNGIQCIMSLVYTGEIASTNIRGLFLTVSGIFGALGTLIVVSVGPYVPYAVTNYIGMAMSVLYLSGLFLIPETPIFQILKGRDEQAKDTLIALGRTQEIDQLTTIKSEKDKPKQSNWTELFTVKSNRRAFFILFTLNILQQLSGVVAVLFFVTRIFQLAGSSIEPNIATIIIAITVLISSCITPFFVERSGRKIILLVSTGLCFLSLAILGIYFFLEYTNNEIIQSIQWLPLVTIMMFFVSNQSGFGIIPATLTGEMFHSNVRSIGSTITMSVPWIFGFGVSTAFGYMITGIGVHFTFWIFSAACALAFIFTAVFVPETKGKSFLEIQKMLSS